jgi:hypothetical protein
MMLRMARERPLLTNMLPSLALKKPARQSQIWPSLVKNEEVLLAAAGAAVCG